MNTADFSSNVFHVTEKYFVHMFCTVCKGLTLSIDHSNCRVRIDSPHISMPTVHATHVTAPLTSLNLHASTVQSGGQTVTVNISNSVSQQSVKSCGYYPIILLVSCAFKQIHVGSKMRQTFRSSYNMHYTTPVLASAVTAFLAQYDLF